MSNKDRPGKTISFYADQTTLLELEAMTKHEGRSVSNMLRVLINRAWDLRTPSKGYVVQTKDQSNG